MDIRTFSKLQAVEDKEILRLLLIHLLEHHYNPNGSEVDGFEEAGFGPMIDWELDSYEELDQQTQEEYKASILDLSGIDTEDFERLMKFCIENMELFDDGLLGFFEDKDGEVLPFEIFSPLQKGYLFSEILRVNEITGEIYCDIAIDEQWPSSTQTSLFAQVEAIIEFHLNNVTGE